jgi:hypothetical protein
VALLATEKILLCTNEEQAYNMVSQKDVQVPRDDCG